MNRRSSFSPGFSALAMRAFVSASAVAFVSLCAVGCSDADPVIPQAYVNAQMGPGDNGASKCQLPPGQWLVVGEQYALKTDGDSQNGASISVSCEVRADSGAFVVTGQMVLKNGLNAGSMTISGKVTDKGDQKVRALFTREDTGTFEQEDCALTFTRVKNMGVAAGRIWGDVTCPTAAIADQNRVCSATAEVKFENCTQ